MNALFSPVILSGYIDSDNQPIISVEFSLDRGTHWTPYPTSDCLAGQGVTWQLTYLPPKKGIYLLTMRAIMANGMPTDILGSYLFEAEQMTPCISISTAGTTEGAAFKTHPAVTSIANSDSTRVSACKDLGIRPIGCKPLGHAMLYRSPAFPADPSVASTVASLGIHAIYDLRTSAELSSDKTLLFGGIKNVSLTPSTISRRKNATNRLVAGVIEAYGEPGERMKANYRSYVNDYPMIGFALRSIAAQGETALLHCANGKDRTGVMCAVLERAAGLPEDFILSHYLESNLINADAICRDEAILSPGMTSHEHEILMSFLEARPEYLREFFREISLRFGSFNAYLTNALGLTPNQIEILKIMTV